jgi:hypothetical protein
MRMVSDNEDCVLVVAVRPQHILNTGADIPDTLYNSEVPITEFLYGEVDRLLARALLPTWSSC